MLNKVGAKTQLVLMVLVTGVLLWTIVFSPIFPSGSADFWSTGLDAQHGLQSPIDVSGPALQYTQRDNLDSSIEASTHQDENAKSLRRKVDRALFGKIVDEQGDPIEGACVSATANSLHDFGISSGQFTFEEWSGLSRQAFSDADGLYSFNLDSISGPYTIWVTAPGYRAETSQLDSAIGEVGFTLEACEPWSVLVKGAGGGEDVFVEIRGRSKGELLASGLYDFLPEQLLMRRFPISVGRSSVFGVNNSFLARAVSSNTLGPWTGPFEDRHIKLDLEKGVLITGRVTGSESFRPCEVIVEHDSINGQWEAMCSIPVQEDGQLFPTHIPRRLSGVYRVQLEGQLLVPQVQRFEASTVGNSLDVNFVASSGTKISFRVHDPNRTAVRGANTRLFWTPIGPGAELETQNGLFRTDENGIVEYTVPDHGEIYIGCLAKGFSYGEWGPLDIPTFAPFVNDLELSPAGQIEGRVVFDGKAVDQFSIVHFQGTGFMQYSPTDFQGTEDGSFTLDNVVSGEIEIFATARGYAQSTPLLIEITPGEVSYVELELGVGGSGTGQVLDAETRLPIQGLQIHRCVFARSGVIGAELGTFFEPRSDGEFDVLGLVGDQGRVAFRAEGYADGDANASRKPDGTYDFGLVLMTRSVGYSGMVELPDDVDPTSVSVEVIGATYFGPAKLDAVGRFEALGAKAGFVVVDFVMPGGAEISVTRLLTGSGPWEDEFDLSGSSSLSVFVDGLSGLPDEVVVEDCQIILTRASSNNLIDSVSSSFGFTNSAEEGNLCTGLVPGSYSVALVASPRVLLAMASVDVSIGSVNEVHLQIKGDQRAIRVVNHQREPVDGAYISVAGESANGVISKAYSNDEGLALLGFLSDGPKAIHIGDYSEAQLDVVLDEIGTAENPTEIVYAPSTSVILQVNDRGTPLEGVTIMVESTLTSRVISWTTVAKGGNINMNSVSPGPVRIFTLSPGLWQEYRSAEISDSEPVIDVQFRRLGAFEIKVTDAFGKPIANAPVALTSDEYGEDVATWLAEGKVTAAAGLVTNSNGVVRVDGLPNGPFTWSVEGEFGKFSVPPNGVGLVNAQVVK